MTLIITESVIAQTAIFTSGSLCALIICTCISLNFICRRKTKQIKVHGQQQQQQHQNNTHYSLILEPPHDNGSSTATAAVVQGEEPQQQQNYFDEEEDDETIAAMSSTAVPILPTATILEI